MKNKKISTLLLSIIALPMLSMEDPSVLRQQRKAIPFVIEFIMQACRNPDVPITVAIPSSLSKGLASQESLDSCTDNAVEKNGFYEFRHPNGILPLIVRLKSKESSITCLYSSVQGFSKLKSARLEMNQETKEVFPYENIKVCHRPGVQNIHTVIDVEGATVAQISTSRATLGDEHAQDVFTAVHPYIQRQQMKKALQDVTISPSAAAVEAQACPKKDKKAKSKARKK